MEVLDKIKETAKEEVDREKKESKPAIKLKEGKVAKAIESVASKIPNDLFLWGSIAAMAGAFTLKFFNKKHTSLFVGQWAAPILIMGVYNKLVKLHGSEK